MAILMTHYNHHKNTGLVLDWGLNSESLWAESISSKQRVITVGFISHVVLTHVRPPGRPAVQLPCGVAVFIICYRCQLGTTIAQYCVVSYPHKLDASIYVRTLLMNANIAQCQENIDKIAVSIQTCCNIKHSRNSLWMFSFNTLMRVFLPIQ